MAGTRLSPIVWALAISSLGASCAHAPPPLHATKLDVHTSDQGGVRPLIRAKVAGYPVTFVLDTGTFRSVLPYSFAQEHHLLQQARATGDFTVDAFGKWVPMQMVSDVPVQFEGEQAGGGLDFIINGSEMGLLAAQDIVRSGGALVIDLARGQLTYEPEESALARLRADASAPLHELDFSRCIHEGFFERNHRAVSVSVNGVPAKMLIDTGASRTVLARNNPALASMLSVQGSRGTTVAATSTGQGLMIEDVAVVFSETAFKLPVLVHPVSSQCWQGAVGADLLSHCTLVWGYSSLWAACHAAASGSFGDTIRK